MGLILFLVAYLAYAAFWCRIALHALAWYKASRRFGTAHLPPSGGTARVYASAVLDLILFRRLFLSSKMLWIGSWIFHVSFFFVILRHLRYFLNPVPACITFLQPVGVVAGYTLPASLFFLIILRLFGRKRYVSKYVSYYNFFLLGLLLAISSTGLLMHTYFMTDVVAVKEFILGIFAFKLRPLPESVIFRVHFMLVLLLLPYLPTHFFSAPLVIVEARKREEELKTVIHGK
jgi:nitrate reductase gamma subunit